MSKPRKPLNPFSQALLKATRITGMASLGDAARLLRQAQQTLLHPVSGSLLHPGAGASAVRAATPAAAQGPSSTPVASRRRPESDEKSFAFDGEHYPYRLYLPAPPDSAHAAPQAGMPLIVLLHGCKQNAHDFARGTAMNALADAHRCMVLYPEQIAKSNSQRCWNWFEPNHQQLGKGEPGMIAALTRQVLASDYNGQRADPTQVYIAGLSAGGAMAAVVAGLYPDIFAAAGVHSGLASGSARDLMSAFSAMRRGAKGREGQLAPAMPTIVFHGSADKTVHPDNGEHISDAAVAALKASGLSLVKSRSAVGTANEPTTERLVYRTAGGPSYVEHWRIEAGAHAWSGGDAAGSYTDPQGPSASAAMLAFFLQHKLQARAAHS